MAFLQIVQADGQGGRKIEIDRDELTIGRSSSSNIPIDDPAASSRHCMVKRDGRKYTLYDLNSTNGTFLNDDAVKELRLKPKDIITVGSLQIVFDGDDVEIDESTRVQPPAATVRTVSVRPDAFGPRRSTRGIWLAVGVVVLIVVACLAYWFLKELKLLQK